MSSKEQQHDDIRLLILTRNRKIKELNLTDHQLTIIRKVKDGFNTAAKLAKLTDTSIQCSSQKLMALYHKGYLDRVETVQKSGGLEYIYKSRF